MKPVVDGLAGEYKGAVEFKLYNVENDDEGARLADSLGVRYVPTFVFVSADGTVVETVVGEMTGEKMRATLDSLK